VVDLDPATGVRDLPLLKLLGSRRVDGEIPFGLDGEVIGPGLVAAGDPVEPVPG
jgi:hypothetical protein